MSKITGVKSVDFKITAYGYGVVNWNGSTTLTGDDGVKPPLLVPTEIRHFSYTSSHTA
jgi:hypothetical protein